MDVLMTLKVVASTLWRHDPRQTNTLVLPPLWQRGAIMLKVRSFLVSQLTILTGLISTSMLHVQPECHMILLNKTLGHIQTARSVPWRTNDGR